jgi:hypothetical protein
MVVPARSFFVAAMEGPLPDGELERAKTWGAELVRTYGASVPSPRTAVTTRQRDPR